MVSSVFLLWITAKSYHFNIVTYVLISINPMAIVMLSKLSFRNQLQTIS